jgi:hypothetical protein
MLDMIFWFCLLIYPTAPTHDLSQSLRRLPAHERGAEVLVRVLVRVQLRPGGCEEEGGRGRRQMAVELERWNSLSCHVDWRLLRAEKLSASTH